MFKDRKDAGQRLALALEKYKNRNDVIVLAIPRGGVEVGAEVAKYLHSDFDLLICRKLAYPFNPESGFGALCEDGTLYINEYALQGVTQEDIYEAIQKQQIEIRHRIQKLRNNRPLKNIQNKIVILVDDGIAMGSTMTAAIEMIKKMQPKKIVVAVPTAPLKLCAIFHKLPMR
ncbi:MULTISPECIES: phosphoribosyltransferase [unclassified Nitratiruptor]|uniref:phosphoribosyltransferase n=1 Tax=unclassified Nitratiruptor TaxID=2624044 RepID=UPI0019157192|nr:MULTISPECIES: phosphoribosyltransferase family protein [unclassified Nitratiruptor]BCD59574.1 putative phosphoribosyl transferase [Nitratiruptor sp. YY08-10]BCD63498.1 putative phosphoribosyl transferase [Nitratiruptor sp. YY08-14]